MTCVLQYSDVCTAVQNAMYSVIPAVMLLVSIEFKVGKSQLVEYITYYCNILWRAKKLAAPILKVSGASEVLYQLIHKRFVLAR